MATFNESDLFAPVKAFFQCQGYQVNGEVCGCDATAIKGDELIVIELKKSFNLSLVYQALDRQKMATQVYVCIPRPAKFNRSAQKGMLNLVKACGLGLLTVALDSPLQTVDVWQLPINHTPTGKKRFTRLQTEIAGRTHDTNIGGSRGTKMNTAYRERAIRIMCILEKTGSASAKQLVHHYGCAKDAYNILHGNPYGWFEKTARGMYGLSQLGADSLSDPAFHKLVAYYRGFIDN